MKKLHQKRLSELRDGIDTRAPGYSLKGKWVIKERNVREWMTAIVRKIERDRTLTFKMPTGERRTIHFAGKDIGEAEEILYYFLLDYFEIEEGSK